MKNPMHKAPERSRLSTIGHSVSDHTVEAGHKIREEFDDVAPKVTAAASKAAHTVAHTAVERSRPMRAEAASRGSAALSGLLGEVTPAQIERMSRRGRSGRGKAALLLAAAGGVVLWAMWWKRSEATLAPLPEESAEVDREPVAAVRDPQAR